MTDVLSRQPFILGYEYALPDVDDYAVVFKPVMLRLTASLVPEMLDGFAVKHVLVAKDVRQRTDDLAWKTRGMRVVIIIALVAGQRFKVGRNAVDYAFFSTTPRLFLCVAGGHRQIIKTGLVQLQLIFRHFEEITDAIQIEFRRIDLAAEILVELLAVDFQ